MNNEKVQKKHKQRFSIVNDWFAKKINLDHKNEVFFSIYKEKSYNQINGEFNFFIVILLQILNLYLT